MSRPKFGAQRLALPEVGVLERALFRTMGTADPAHYLHSRYLIAALDSWPGWQPRRILDAGCGRGDYSFYLAERYPDAQVTGIDVDVGRIERNRLMAGRLGFTNVHFEVNDLVMARFNEQFDLIVSIDVLEHIVRQADALRNLASHLAPHGRAFYHIPAKRERPVPFSRWLHGFHEWAAAEHVAEDLSAEEFIAAVERSGLAVESSRRTFGYYTGEMAVSLFALPYKNTPFNRMLQGMIAPACRLLAMLDHFGVDRTRYAVATIGRSPA